MEQGIISIIILLIFWQVPLAWLQVCNNTVQLDSMRFEPSPFRGVISIIPVPSCGREFVGIVCELPTVLADDNFGPQQPDLNNENDIRKFVAWSSNNLNMYLTLVPQSHPAVVSTIDIHLLNYPSHGVSVPNFKLYGLNVSTAVNVPSVSDPVLDFDIINNNDLTQEDNIVRRITLRIRSPASFMGYLLRWNFDNLLNTSWLMMSEISLCNGPLPNYDTSSILFKSPVRDNTIITPQSELLINGSIMLTCTVSNEGQFMWQWFNGTGDNLTSTSSNTAILSAEGTRSSVLITQINIIETSIIYSCYVSFTIKKSYFTRSFEINPNQMRTSEKLITSTVFREDTRPSKASTSDSAIGTGVLIGIVLAAVVLFIFLVTAICGIFIIFCRRRTLKMKKNKVLEHEDRYSTVNTSGQIKNEQIGMDSEYEVPLSSEYETPMPSEYEVPLPSKKYNEQITMNQSHDCTDSLSLNAKQTKDAVILLKANEAYSACNFK